MKYRFNVGDLVKARHWGTGYIGLIMSIRVSGIRGRGRVCRVMINTGDLIDLFENEDLEVIG